MHFFEGFAPTKTEPGKVVGKINWRVSEPDGRVNHLSNTTSLTRDFFKSCEECSKVL